jgi:ribulose-phosphate 3-epimerase
MHEVLPGILEKSWEDVEKRLHQVSSFAKKVHIDLIDESFADSRNFFDPTPFTSYSKDIFFELHMMVKDPIQYLDAWSGSGIRRFIGHIEQMPDQAEFVAIAQELGEVGLALDIDTQIDEIKVSYEDLDAVLIMMCKAGLSGQSFQSRALDKVRALRQRNDFLDLEVDGGITDKTIKECYSAGATRFVSTSYLFWQEEDPKIQYQKLLRVIES